MDGRYLIALFIVSVLALLVYCYRKKINVFLVWMDLRNGEVEFWQSTIEEIYRDPRDSALVRILFYVQCQEQLFCTDADNFSEVLLEQTAQHKKIKVAYLVGKFSGKIYVQHVEPCIFDSAE